METLVFKAIEEVALEGAEGTSSVILPPHVLGYLYICISGNEFIHFFACCAFSPSLSSLNRACLRTEHEHIFNAACTVPCLWQCLAVSHQLAASLTDPLKQAIWAALLEPGTSVALCHPPKGTNEG